MGTTHQDIQINVPVDKVWKAIEEVMTFSYSIDDGPSPVSKEEVSNYIGRVVVEP
jgi:hypothetical protein